MQLLKRPAVVNGYFPDVALVGGVAAGAVVEKLLGSDMADVRAAAAETCARGIFSESTLRVLAKRTADSSAKVRRAAIGALAVAATWGQRGGGGEGSCVLEGRWVPARPQSYYGSADEEGSCTCFSKYAEGSGAGVRACRSGSRHDVRDRKGRGAELCGGD